MTGEEERMQGRGNKMKSFLASLSVTCPASLSCVILGVALPKRGTSLNVFLNHLQPSSSVDHE